MDPQPSFRLQLLGPPVLTGRNGTAISGRAGQRHRLALLAVLARGGRRRLEPMFADLRADPRFARILARWAEELFSSQLLSRA